MNASSCPRVLAVLPRVIPSTVIGVIKPLTWLHRQKRIALDLTVEYLVARRQVAAADVIVFCRNTLATYANALNWAQELGKPIIYELDDDLLDLPASVEANEAHRDPDRTAQLRAYLAAANLVRVYSGHLREKILRLNSNVTRVDGPVDWSLIPREPMPKNSKVQIVYATSRIVDDLANIFADDVLRLLDEFPNQVELTLWGCRLEKLSRHPAVRARSFVTDYNRFFSQFARGGFDIGLAPLRNDPFYLAKSNNKFREYGACRIAGVYSNVAVYADCVQAGATGLLVPNEPAAWFDALARLVRERDLRERIQNQAQVFAREHYDLEKFANEWLEQIKAVMVQTPHPVKSILDSHRNPAEHGNPIWRLAARVPRLILRFAQSIRTRGARRSLEMARWTLNDFSVLGWKWWRNG
jgi:glycosyltransferase involved in cell wall biosynthesis